mgnify:CR=1 FL=1
MTGTAVMADLDISGDVDVDGTLEADTITVMEKIGQLNQYSSFFDVTGPKPTSLEDSIKYEQIKSYLITNLSLLYLIATMDLNFLKTSLQLKSLRT